MSATRAQSASPALDAFVDIVGSAHVLTSERATSPYAKGNRFGGGKVLAVLRPGSLVEMWRLLNVCVEHDLIVIPQAANTGLTGGSSPGNSDYDRDIVIVSTLRIDQIFLINDAREAVCLAGSTLIDLTDILAPRGREPHSVIGSSSIGASVIGGIANNSGGSQIRKGPAFTEQAVYAWVDEAGQVRLVNHLGIELGAEPEQILEKLQQGSWAAADVSPPPEDGTETEYAAHVREIVDSPARYNANPKYLHEVSGCAGKLMVFAVRTRTFPLEMSTTSFYIGSNSPAELEEIRREIFRSELPLPISGEYMDRAAFDLARKYGKDTFMGLKYAGTRQVEQLFALKKWANGVFAKLRVFGPAFGDVVSQRLFDLVPNQLPKRIASYRDRFAHHLILEVSSRDTAATEKMLTAFFDAPGHDGSFFVCTDDEAETAMLLRFGAASAVNRYHTLYRKRVGDMVTFDVALRRDDDDWLEVLPPEIADQLAASVYFGHFFCHVLHQNHVAKGGVDSAALKKRMTALLTERGAKLPAEHNFGHLYPVPADLEAHYRKLDPRNMFNPGIGGLTAHKNWS